MTRRFGGARLALGLAGACLICAPAALEAQETQPRTHDVRPGDTLWDLSRTYLGDPFLWPEIFRLNVEAIRDPALIYPTMRLRLPGREPAVAVGPDTVPREAGRTVFWRPEARTEQVEEMIIRPAGTADVPIISPGDYYAASFVAEEHEVAPVAVLAERLDESVVPVVLEPAVTLFDVVYMAIGPGEDVRIGDRLHLVRSGAAVRNQGRVYRPTGVARVLDVTDGTATAEIIEVYEPIRVGDLALPVPVFPVEPGVSPTRIEAADMEGRILGFEEPNVIQMTQGRAWIDLGARHGMREGDEILAFIPPVERGWGVRPEVDVAVLRVVRVMERSATARVIRLEHPALEAGMAVRHVARMP